MSWAILGVILVATVFLALFIRQQARVLGREVRRLHQSIPPQVDLTGVEQSLALMASAIASQQTETRTSVESVDRKHTPGRMRLRQLLLKRMEQRGL